MTRHTLQPGNKEKTVDAACQHLLDIGRAAIEKKGAFYLALSGGSTPLAIFAKLGKEDLDWGKVHIFWSDERACAPQDAQSNYGQAMASGFKDLPIPKAQIHRMVAEQDIEDNALAYEERINTVVPDARFDLVMLGMGDDGHTASLFPRTKGLDETKRLVIENFVPQKDCFRMSFTYPLINQAHHVVIYVMGAGKGPMLAQIFGGASDMKALPILGVTDRALWIMDEAAATASV